MLIIRNTGWGDIMWWCYVGYNWAEFFRLYLVKSLHRGYHLAASCLGDKIQAYAELSSWDLPTPSIYEEPTYPLQIHSKVNFQSLHRTSLGRNKGQAISNEHAVIKVRLVLVKDIHMYECENSACGLPMAARSAYVRLHLPRPMSTSSWIFTSIYWEKTS